MKPKIKKYEPSAQRIVDTCIKHGCINWAVLRELVWCDVEKAVKNKEYKEWAKK